MNLKQSMEQDLIQALKQSDSLRTGVLRYFKAILLRAEIDQRITLDDDAIIKLLQKEIKKRRDAIQQFRAGGREDLVQKETEELKVLQAYAPPQLGQDEIERMVDKVVLALRPSGMKEMGTVMSAVMEKLGGRADGSLVAKIVKQKLQP